MFCEHLTPARITSLYQAKSRNSPLSSLNLLASTEFRTPIRVAGYQLGLKNSNEDAEELAGKFTYIPPPPPSLIPQEPAGLLVPYRNQNLQEQVSNR